MAPNVFPGGLFINPSVLTLCLKDPQIRNHNSSGTSSSGQGESLEQYCLGIGNSKIRT